MSHDDPANGNLPKTAVNPELAARTDGELPQAEAGLPRRSAEAAAEAAAGVAKASQAVAVPRPAARPTPAVTSNVPIRYLIPPLSVSFSEDELVRVGRSTSTPPTNRVGLLVVRRSPQPVRLGQVVPLREARAVLGRGRGVACFLDDDLAAEFSAVLVHEVTVAGGGYVLHVPAAGCALLNGIPTHRVTLLSSGDVITLGRTDLVFFEVAFDDASA